MDQLIRPQKWNDFWYGRAWKQWAKKLIVLSVIAASVLLAIVGSVDVFLIVLVLIAALIALGILLQWPALGLFGVVLGGFFVPYSGPGGVNLAVIGVAGTTALWIVDMIVRQRKISFAETKVNRPIAIFILSAFVSFSVGQLPWYPLAQHAPLDAQLGGMMIFIFSGCAFLVVGNLMRDIRWLQVFTWMFVAIGGLWVMARIVPPVFRMVGSFYQNGATAGAVFWVWLLVIPFSQLVLNRHLSKFWKAALAVLLAGTLYVAVVQSYDWKSGFIPPLAGMAFIVALMLKKRVVWFFPLLIGMAIYVGIQAIESDQYSWFSRLEAWFIVSKLTMVNPIFGIGFANYYWYTHLVPINGWHVSFNSHSQFVDIFSQTGLLGLICFFWIFWEIFKLGWQLKDRAPEGFMKAYVYGALGGLAGSMVAGGLVDWILPFVYNIGMYGFRSSVIGWLFLGGLVAINQIIKNPSFPETSAPSIRR